MGWLEETPDKESKVALLVALRDITDGKIFVEAERAKLTRMLAKVKKKRRMVGFLFFFFPAAQKKTPSNFLPCCATSHVRIMPP